MIAVLLALALATVPPIAAVDSTSSGLESSPPASWCGTETMAGPAEAASPVFVTGCPTRGPCDDPGVRDATTIENLVVPVVAHVIRSRDGSCNLSAQTVQSEIDRLNIYFSTNATGFSFRLDAVRIHTDDSLAWIPGCDSAGCDAARAAILRTKLRYAESPRFQCNVYFSCMAGHGGIAGVGAYPWFTGGLGRVEGVWLDAQFTGGANALSHEMGHVLGLLHVFRGVTEVAGCQDACAEHAGDANADRTGDLVSDTRATPIRRLCSDPQGSDCTGRAWGATPYDNLMGYAPSSCARRFTSQQVLRMQCWAKQAYPGWFTPASVAAKVRVSVAPNPAVHEAGVCFEIPQATSGRIEIFDLLGRRVARLADGALAPGSATIFWDGRSESGRRAPPGVYVARAGTGVGSGQATFAWRP